MSPFSLSPLQRILHEMRQAVSRLPWPAFSSAQPEGERREPGMAGDEDPTLLRRKDDSVGGEGGES
jgi:hypothetical protein